MKKANAYTLDKLREDWQFKLREITYRHAHGEIDLTERLKLRNEENAKYLKQLRLLAGKVSERSHKS